jgi:hypothetical protein
MHTLHTGGQPNEGVEGFGFIGDQHCDAVVRCDLSQGKKLPELVPERLAKPQSWFVDLT